MAMKALFDQSPFPPLRLSPAECQKFEMLAKEQLRKALLEYDHFGPPPARTFHKSRWKVVKNHESCTVYVDRATRSSKENEDSGGGVSALAPFDPYNTLASNGLSSLSFSSSEDSSEAAGRGSPRESTQWKIPELVVSGTVPGTLEDVMYGMSTHDSAEMMLRTAYVDDHLLDGAVLNQIQMPTPEDPFRFLGVKWYVNGIPSSYQKFVWPRDFVFLEASGVITRQDGTRLGYLLRHSVGLPTCGDLRHHGVLRGRFANCAIYTQLSNNTVDLFVRGNVDPGGKMAQSLAITIAANALLSSSNAVFCAYNKKLLWLLGSQKSGDHTIPMVRSNMFACGMCSKKFGKLSSVGTCRICCVQMCSRCRMTRSLSFVDAQKNHAVEQFSGVFCKNCIAHANQSSAFEVAQHEIQSGRYGPVVDQETSEQRQQRQVAAPPKLATTPMPPRVVSSQYRNLKSDAISSVVSIGSSSISTTVTDSSRDSQASSFSSEYEPELEEICGDEIGEFHEWTAPQSAAAGVPGMQYHSRSDVVPAMPIEMMAAPHQPQQPQQPSGHRDPNQERQELWRKMTELRLQAESVYQLTKHNATVHLHGSTSVVEPYDSDVEALD